MSEIATIHPWSEEALFGKAQLYVERMESCTADDWQFGFWSALTLELLARAALAHVSPVLLAEGNNWRNLAYALGNDQTSMKHLPRSVSMAEVLSRLKELIPDFTDEISGFCGQHTERRNAEIHSGELAFVNVGTSMWLPRFYLACDVLLQSMNRRLEDFVLKPDEAHSIISEFKNSTASSVREDIKAYEVVWQNKNDDEREEAQMQAVTWATRQNGHRVECPACGSQALLQGRPSGIVTTDVSGNEVVQKQTHLPSSFECIACGLRISGLSRLTAARLGNAFSITQTYTAAEFFELYTEEELEDARNEWLEYEPDYNE